jgi:ABC-2 type transport system permease protein
MKPVIEIAKAELKKMFYSPVAWLVLIAFTFHVLNLFVTCVGVNLHAMSWGEVGFATLDFFSIKPIGGKFFFNAMNVFYIYIPLLAMNILSREYSSGTIKLLFSSPISNAQIILGKYLSLLLFGILMLLIIAIPGIAFGTYIVNAEWSIIFNGLVGIFMLYGCYAAISLFMSSLTTHAIISVITTLAVLMFLSNAGEIGQETPFLRDIFYWFSISGRATTYLEGLISTESIIYFLAVIGFFLGLAYVKLKASREKQSRTAVAGQYFKVVLITCLVGYCSSLPELKVYWDLTRSQVHTLSKESREIMKKLDGGLTITTYINMLDPYTSHLVLPRDQKKDMSRYNPYLRFKPETRIRYKYYYKDLPVNPYASMYPGKTSKELLDTLREVNNWNFDIVPYQEIEKEADLASEDFRFVSKIERENGQQTFLRVFNDPTIFPDEIQITAALKRFVNDLPAIGYVTGHGERSIASSDSRGYHTFFRSKTFRYSLVNNGFDVTSVDLLRPVPEEIRIMLLADNRQPFSDIELLHFQQYLNRGGNLLITTDPARDSSTGPVLAMLGVHTTPGMLIQPKEDIVPEVILSSTNTAATALSYFLQGPGLVGYYKLVMNSATGLIYEKNKGFDVLELFSTDSTSTWNEMETMNVREEPAIYHPAAGELRQTYVTGLALSRKINDKHQKIIVTSDADWLSNGEMETDRGSIGKLNGLFIYAAFHYLSNGQLPIDVRIAPPTDNVITLEPSSWKAVAPFVKWGGTIGLLLAALFILIRRRGR